MKRTNRRRWRRMIHVGRVLLRAYLDAQIGWHQGHAERRASEAARHAERERYWRARYKAAFPSVWDQA